MLKRITATLGSSALGLFLQFGAEAAYAAGPELVTNGGFETGSFSGWTTTDSPGATLYGVDGAGPHNGSYSAYFGALDPSDVIAQTLATAIGAHYTISFYLDSESTSDGTAGFVGKFGGTTFVSLSDANDDFTFKPFTFDVVATATSTLLSFSAFNEAWYYTLDDVSVKSVTTVSAVPEPETYAMLLAGLAAVGWVGRRRARR